MRLVAVSTVALLIAGCAGQAPPPDIAYDTPAAAAAFPPAAAPLQIVEIPKPLPLPGQLKPAPGRATSKGDRGVSTARIAAANRAARREPDRDGFIDAIQIWPYTPDALYQLYTAMGNVTDI